LFFLFFSFPWYSWCCSLDRSHKNNADTNEYVNSSSNSSDIEPPAFGLPFAGDHHTMDTTSSDSVSAEAGRQAAFDDFTAIFQVFGLFLTGLACLQNETLENLDSQSERTCMTKALSAYSSWSPSPPPSPPFLSNPSRSLSPFSLSSSQNFHPTDLVEPTNSTMWYLSSKSISIQSVDREYGL
jgi:hypothetical protein